MYQVQKYYLDTEGMKTCLINRTLPLTSFGYPNRSYTQSCYHQYH